MLRLLDRVHVSIGILTMKCAAVSGNSVLILCCQHICLCSTFLHPWL